MRRWFVATWVCVLAYGCGDDGGPNVAGPEALNEHGFPLALGNTWVYEVSSEETDSVGTTSFDAIVTWEVEELDVVFDEPAFRVRTTFGYRSGPREGERVSGLTWYSQRGDTLWALASQDIGGFDPVSVQLSKSAGPQQGDPYSWGANVLIFPLQTGMSWDFSKAVSGIGRKTVAAVEVIEVPAGEFKAFRVVRSSTGRTGGFRVDQWFSSIGIVRVTDEQTIVAPSGEVVSSTISTAVLSSYEVTP